MTNTNRRHLLKIAAGLGLAGAIPTSAERIAAMKQLEHQVAQSPVLDPATFAHETDGAAANHLGNDWFGAVNAELHAEYQHHREAFLQSRPELQSTKFDDPFTRFDEAMFNFVDEAYTVGIRHGAAYEHLRRTVIGDLSECRTCWGVGLAKDATLCNFCGGTGIVTTGAQIGRLDGGD